MNSDAPEAGAEQLPKRRLHWPRTPTGMSLVGFSQVGLFVIVLCYVLHEMKPVLLPLVLAVLVSLIFHPVYMLFRRLHLPRLLCSALTVSGLMAALAFGVYQAIVPAVAWSRSVNEEQMLGWVQEVFRPMKKVRQEIKQIADRVEKAAQEKVGPEPKMQPGEGIVKKLDEVLADVAAGDPKIFMEKPESLLDRRTEDGETERGEIDEDAGRAVMVEIREDPMALLLTKARELGIGFAAFLLTVLFILAYGHRIVSQLYRDTHLAVILERMGSEVSRYMFTITIINACLAICVGLAMWGMGMPRPVLWGLMAMVLNFVPYVGALTGTVVIFLAAAVSFAQPGMVVAVSVVYFALTAIEGNVVTPMVLGGRFRINPLVVFVWIFAWAGFWGVAGLLIAMPALVIFKIACENTEKMKRFQRVLAG